MVNRYVFFRGMMIAAALFGLFPGIAQCRVHQPFMSAPADSIPADSVVTVRKLSALSLPEAGFRPGYRVVLTDSLLRWQQWADGAEWLASRPEMNIHRTGSMGRAAAWSSAGAPNTGFVFWNGISLSDPLTRQMNPDRITPEHLAVYFERNGSSVYEASIIPLEFRVSRPLTRFTYEQSSYNFRSLDGTLAVPVSADMQFQVYYQGRKEDGRYRRSGYEARRSGGSVLYDAGKGWIAEMFAMYQGSEADEPLGYRFEHPGDFAFDRFTAVPNSSNTYSRDRFFITGVRLKRNESKPDDGITLYRQLNRYDWRATQVFYQRSVQAGVIASHTWEFGSFAVKPILELGYARLGGNALSEASTGLKWHAGGEASYQPVKHLTLSATGHAESTAGQRSLRAAADATIHLPASFHFKGGWDAHAADQPLALLHTVISDFTPLYIGDDFSGKGVAFRVYRDMGKLQPFVSFKTGTESGVAALDADSAFVLFPDAKFRALWAGLNAAGRHFEAGVHGGTSAKQRDGGYRHQHQARISGYVKGPVLEAAAYLKFGAVVTMAGKSEYSPLWIPEHNLWVDARQPAMNPAYTRLDLEFSARVRSLILTGRLENALDEWTQNGYFETLPYPMPARRFRLGLKVVFRD